MNALTIGAITYHAKEQSLVDLDSSEMETEDYRKQSLDSIPVTNSFQGLINGLGI